MSNAISQVFTPQDVFSWNFSDLTTIPTEVKVFLNSLQCQSTSPELSTDIPLLQNFLTSTVIPNSCSADQSKMLCLANWMGSLPGFRFNDVWNWYPSIHKGQQEFPAQIKQVCSTPDPFVCPNLPK
jgi:hypothetical protein